MHSYLGRPIWGLVPGDWRVELGEMVGMCVVVRSPALAAGAFLREVRRALCEGVRVGMSLGGAERAAGFVPQTRAE